MQITDELVDVPVKVWRDNGWVRDTVEGNVVEFPEWPSLAPYTFAVHRFQDHGRDVWRVTELSSGGYCGQGPSMVEAVEAAKRAIERVGTERVVDVIITENGGIPRLRRPRAVETWADLARAWSRRSTCPRASVGCVVVDRDGHILTSGFNGAPRGLPHCDEVGCLMVDGHCERALHAEENAILQAARQGTALNGRGAILVTTHRPCSKCCKMIIQVGIVGVIYLAPYNSDQLEKEVLTMFQEAGVWCQKGLENDPPHNS